MFFRRIGWKQGKTAKLRNAKLSLEHLEERCVPSATDLGAADAYNGFIFNNFTGTNSDVAGRLAVGAKATLTNYGIGAALSNSHGARVDLTVGNNLSYLNGEVFNGDVVYGHSASLTRVGVPNGTVSMGTPVNFNAVETDLDAKSSTWATFGTTGTIASNWGNLDLTGTNAAINIFNLTASQLQNIYSISINAPAGSTVLVNVSGTSATLQYMGISINGTDPSRVLFNFSQATSLTLQGIGFNGNILAPYANVNFNNGEMTGTLVALNFCGNGQLNPACSNIDIPNFIPAVISGTVFQDLYDTGIPQPGEPGLTPVIVVLQGVNNTNYYSTTTDANGNYSITVTQPGTYTMSIIDLTGLGYSIVSLHVGGAGGIASLTLGEIENIVISGALVANNYNFGLNNSGSTGEHP